MERIAQNRSARALALGLVVASVFLAVLLIGAIAPGQAYAGGVRAKDGAKSYSLSFNKVCKKYDITGDKKADSIVVTTNKKDSHQPFTTVTVKINGKKVFSKSGLKSYIDQDRVQVIRLKNKQPFLYLQCFSYEPNKVNLSMLLQYKDGKLVDALSTNKLMGKSFFANRAYTTIVDEVKGNTVDVQLYNAKTYGFGDLFIKAKYQYKKSGLAVPSTITADLFEYPCELYKSVPVYKDKACKVKIGRLAKHREVKFVEVCNKGNLCVAKVKFDGKTGWVKCDKKAGRLVVRGSFS